MAKSQEAKKQYQREWWQKRKYSLPLSLVDARKRANQAWYGRQSREYHLWLSIRSRCRKNDINFEIDPSDLVPPIFCPVLGIKLEWAVGKYYSDSTPSCDRIKPELGYVKGNVRMISWRANRLRSDASLAELEAVVSYVRELQIDRLPIT